MMIPIISNVIEVEYTKDQIAANRAAWIDALLELDRKQLKSFLEVYGDSGKKQCCLGVACEIAGVTSRDVSKSGEVSYGGAYSILPKGMPEWLGLTTDDPRVRLYTDGVAYALTLSFLNDNGFSFYEIAKLIKAQAASWDGDVTGSNVYTIENGRRIMQQYRRENL